MQEIRPELLKMTNELLNQVNFLAKYGKNKAEYTGLVDTLNNILAETAVLVKSRQTGNSHDEEEI